MSTALIAVPTLLVAANVFKPLLKGIARATMMVVSKPVSKEEQEARRHLRDRRLMQRMMNSSSGPSLSNELQAIAARD
ncbi:hypothetical protein [Massilia sp. TS11]|uniref:hypothetical protein n=1 Tax=Massilia sp. TS11 TaxID=2908003 RepID=UPI001EDA6569|nr:hypothetical protein [Massilia sp. TS11]MCG2585217.1 hypothetical protein [Massilia sp. TS11]